MEEKIESKKTGEGKSGPARIWITALLVIALVASVAGNVVVLLKYYEKKDEYDALAEVHAEEYFVFPSITVDMFKNKVVSGEEFVVLISRPNCGSCQKVSADFIAFCEELEIQDEIYHLNVVELRRDQEAWDEFKLVYELTGTPTYARYANGEQISHLSWTEEFGISIEMAREWIYEQSDFFGLN